MKRLVVVLASMLACAAFAADEGAAPAEGGARRGGRQWGGGMDPTMMMGPIAHLATNPKAVETLGLSEDQVNKLKALGEQKPNRENGQKMREAMKKQADLMKADKVDEAAVMAAIDEVFELRKAAAKEQTKRVIAVKSILTPEQIKKATEEMRTRFEGRRNRQGGDRGPRRDGQGDRGPRKDGKGDKPGQVSAE